MLRPDFEPLQVASSLSGCSIPSLHLCPAHTIPGQHKGHWPLLQATGYPSSPGQEVPALVWPQQERGGWDTRRADGPLWLYTWAGDDEGRGKETLEETKDRGTVWQKKLGSETESPLEDPGDCQGDTGGEHHTHPDLRQPQLDLSTHT